VNTGDEYLFCDDLRILHPLLIHTKIKQGQVLSPFQRETENIYTYMSYLNNTEIVSVIGDFNSKMNQLTTLVDDVNTKKKDLIEYSRQVLFPNHYGTNPLFIKGISKEDKEELRKFLFPNHYKKTFVYKG